MKKWLYGLLVAVISGFASGALTALTMDGPIQWRVVITAGSTMALIAFFTYIKQPPPDPWDGVERRVTPGNGGAL